MLVVQLPAFAAEADEELTKEEEEAHFRKLDLALARQDYVPKTGGCIVFVPYPFPSDEVKDRSLAFVENACRVAAEEGAKIIVVRSGYGVSEMLLKKEPDWLRILRQRWGAKGMFHVVDTLPDGFPTHTPWGFLFIDGKPVTRGNIGEWAKAPAIILNALKRTSVPGTPRPSASPLASERLRQLTKMRDENLISEEEFQLKRAQILNDL